MFIPALLPLALAAAQPPPTTGQITFVGGNWTMVFAGDRAWTIHHLDYEGRTISLGTGFHGAVLDTGAAKEPGQPALIGSGYTEGGREQVEEVSLNVDGQVVPLELGKTYRGGSIWLEKRSMLGHLRHEAVVGVTGNRVGERERFEAVEEQPLKLLCAFMHCWLPTFTRWAAGGHDKPLQGVLDSSGGFQLNQNVGWSALYDPAAELVVVTTYRHGDTWPLPRGLGTRYANLKHCHQQGLDLLRPASIPAGQAFEFNLDLQAYHSPAGEWVAKAEETARYAFGPIVDPPR